MLLIETYIKPERIILVGVKTKDITVEDFDEGMMELHALAETAGGKIKGQLTQNLPAINRQSLIGSGKLSELRDKIKRDDINLIITQNELSPAINQYLEDETGIRVIDRTQLILDIFAMRAKSREGKLQVEMAQYDYLLPRIIGKGLALSRQGGGIGTRGPGETQLESDRRYIRRRMADIRRELDEVEKHRDRTRQKRLAGKEFNIGLIGYTNAGKSTLLKQLTEAETYIQDQLFATLDPKTRRLKINGHDAFTLTDTVGFIEDLPTQLIDAFKSTLEEIRYMDLLLHVVDASHPAIDRHEQTVMALLEELEIRDIPMLTVYNKKDQIIGSFEPSLFPNCVISAYETRDIEQLKQSIWDACIKQMKPFTMTIPQEEAGEIAQYQQNHLVTTIKFDEESANYTIEGYRR